MRYFFLAFLLAAVTVVGIAGFRGQKFVRPPIEIFNDMDHQAKVKAQSPNHFFADGQGARLPVPGTVPMGAHLPTKLAAEGGFDPEGFSHGSDFYNTGKMDNGNYYGDGFPAQVELTEGFIRMGRDLYNVHCFICHGKSGNGKGMLSLDPNHPAVPGLVNVANFLDPKFTDPANPLYVPTGSIYDTITNGKGTMGKYGNNLNVQERWAIISYVRTLNLSANASKDHPAIAPLAEKIKPAAPAP